MSMIKPEPRLFCLKSLGPWSPKNRLKNWFNGLSSPNKSPNGSKSFLPVTLTAPMFTTAGLAILANWEKELDSPEAPALLLDAPSLSTAPGRGPEASFSLSQETASHRTDIKKTKTNACFRTLFIFLSSLPLCAISSKPEVTRKNLTPSPDDRSGILIIPILTTPSQEYDMG